MTTSTPIADSLNLSQSMRAVLAEARLCSRGTTVYVWCSDKRTSAALQRRGARPFECLTLALDLPLTMAAVELASETSTPALVAAACNTPGDMEPGEWHARQVQRNLDTYGEATSGAYSGRDAILWHMVREGTLQAEPATVGAWGALFKGWRFTPVAPTEQQRAAQERVVAERAALPEWQRERLGL